MEPRESAEDSGGNHPAQASPNTPQQFHQRAQQDAANIASSPPNLSHSTLMRGLQGTPQLNGGVPQLGGGNIFSNAEIGLTTAVCDALVGHNNERISSSEKATQGKPYQEGTDKLDSERGLKIASLALAPYVRNCLKESRVQRSVEYRAAFIADQREASLISTEYTDDDDEPHELRSSVSLSSDDWLLSTYLGRGDVQIRLPDVLMGAAALWLGQRHLHAQQNRAFGWVTGLSPSFRFDESQSAAADPLFGLSIPPRVIVGSKTSACIILGFAVGQVDVACAVLQLERTGNQVAASVIRTTIEEPRPLVSDRAIFEASLFACRAWLMRFLSIQKVQETSLTFKSIVNSPLAPYHLAIDSMRSDSATLRLTWLNGLTLLSLWSVLLGLKPNPKLFFWGSESLEGSTIREVGRLLSLAVEGRLRATTISKFLTLECQYCDRSAADVSEARCVLMNWAVFENVAIKLDENPELSLSPEAVRISSSSVTPPDSIKIGSDKPAGEIPRAKKVKVLKEGWTHDQIVFWEQNQYSPMPESQYDFHPEGNIALQEWDYPDDLYSWVEQELDRMHESLTTKQKQAIEREEQDVNDPNELVLNQDHVRDAIASVFLPARRTGLNYGSAYPHFNIERESGYDFFVIGKGCGTILIPLVGYGVTFGNIAASSYEIGHHVLVVAEIDRKESDPVFELTVYNSEQRYGCEDGAHDRAKQILAWNSLLDVKAAGGSVREGEIQVRPRPHIPKVPQQKKFNCGSHVVLNAWAILMGLTPRATKSPYRDKDRPKDFAQNFYPMIFKLLQVAVAGQLTTKLLVGFLVAQGLTKEIPKDKPSRPEFISTEITLDNFGQKTMELFLADRRHWHGPVPDIALPTLRKMAGEEGPYTERTSTPSPTEQLVESIEAPALQGSAPPPMGMLSRQMANAKAQLLKLKDGLLPDPKPQPKRAASVRSRSSSKVRSRFPSPAVVIPRDSRAGSTETGRKTRGTTAEADERMADLQAVKAARALLPENDEGKAEHSSAASSTSSSSKKRKREAGQVEKPDLRRSKRTGSKTPAATAAVQRKPAASKPRSRAGLKAPKGKANPATKLPAKRKGKAKKS